MRRQAGFALLIVLWAVALLSVLMLQVTSAGRVEVDLARNLRGAAVLEAAADGGIAEGIFHLLDTSAAHWAADGTAHSLARPGAMVIVTLQTESGRINPNTAQPELLQALLHQVGADSRTAAAVSAAIVGWRFPDAQNGTKAAAYRAAGRDYGPPGAPFRSLDELGLVLGMTPELLARLRPHLSLYHDGDPDPRSADSLVLAAFRESGGAPPPAEGPPDERVVDVVAVAGNGDGRFARRAVVRFGQRTGGGLYEMLEWDKPEFS